MLKRWYRWWKQNFVLNNLKKQKYPTSAFQSCSCECKVVLQSQVKSVSILSASTMSLPKFVWREQPFCGNTLEMMCALCTNQQRSKVDLYQVPNTKYQVPSTKGVQGEGIIPSWPLAPLHFTSHPNSLNSITWRGGRHDRGRSNSNTLLWSWVRIL